jgi:hypothetical protein
MLSNVELVMNNISGITYKEAVGAQFEVLCQHLSGKTEEINENPSK